jgi:hypothetical protein
MNLPRGPRPYRGAWKRMPHCLIPIAQAEVDVFAIISADRAALFAGCLSRSIVAAEWERQTLFPSSTIRRDRSLSENLSRISQLPFMNNQTASARPFFTTHQRFDRTARQRNQNSPRKSWREERASVPLAPRFSYRLRALMPDSFIESFRVES